MRHSIHTNEKETVERLIRDLHYAPINGRSVYGKNSNYIYVERVFRKKPGRDKHYRWRITVDASRPSVLTNTVNYITFRLKDYHVELTERRHMK